MAPTCVLGSKAWHCTAPAARFGRLPVTKDATAVTAAAPSTPAAAVELCVVLGAEWETSAPRNWEAGLEVLGAKKAGAASAPTATAATPSRLMTSRCNVCPLS